MAAEIKISLRLVKFIHWNRLTTSGAAVYFSSVEVRE